MVQTAVQPQKCHSLETYSYPDWQFLQITNDIGTALAQNVAAGMASIVAKLQIRETSVKKELQEKFARCPSSRK